MYGKSFWGLFEKSSHLQLLLFYFRPDIIIQELGATN